jgi:hypothetical protein
MDGALVGSEYASHLTDADLRLLASAAHGGEDASWLRGDPGTLTRLLGDPRVFDAVFAAGDGFGEVSAARSIAASPFLTFAVAVHRSAAELESVDHVAERAGTRQRVPLFDVPDLRDFLGSPARRLFLAELLASFTRVASGRYRVRGGGGRPRTRRFSELDPVRLAGLLDSVPDADRPGVYRRLGDVSLFLAGVFPDYAAAYAFAPVGAAALLQAAQVPALQHEQLAEAPAIELLEYVGARWYRAACHLAPLHTARLDVVGEVADRFRQARRVLNHIADQYLSGTGSAWFAPPAP